MITFIVLSWGRYHGGRRPSNDDSLHSPTVIPPLALDKPSIMKRYHRRWTYSDTSPRRSPTMVTLHDTRFVECWWWNDGWTVKTVVTWRSSASMIAAPGKKSSSWFSSIARHFVITVIVPSVGTAGRLFEERLGYAQIYTCNICCWTAVGGETWVCTDLHLQYLLLLSLEERLGYVQIYTCNICCWTAVGETWVCTDLHLQYLLLDGCLRRDLGMYRFTLAIFAVGRLLEERLGYVQIYTCNICCCCRCCV